MGLLQTGKGLLQSPWGLRQEEQNKTEKTRLSTGTRETGRSGPPSVCKDGKEGCTREKGSSPKGDPNAYSNGEKDSISHGRTILLAGTWQSFKIEEEFMKKKKKQESN